MTQSIDTKGPTQEQDWDMVLANENGWTKDKGDMGKVWKESKEKS